MQMMNHPKSSAKIVWIYSAITGICVGILWVVASHLPGPVLVTLPMLTVVAFLLVGMLASKQTNRGRTGTLAGLVAGLTTEIILLWVVPLLQGAKLNLFSLEAAFHVIMVLGIGAGMG